MDALVILVTETVHVTVKQQKSNCFTCVLLENF